MYFSRSSSQSELIRITFSVMLSTVRSFMGGILTLLGSIFSLSLFSLGVVIWVSGEDAIGERGRVCGGGGCYFFYMLTAGTHPTFPMVGGGWWVCKLRDGYWLGWFGYAAT